MAGCLPFLTLGMLGNHAATIAASCVGVAALLTLTIRFAMLLRGNVKPARIAVADTIANEIMSFPYAIALSSTILICHDTDATSGLWLSALLCLIIAFANIISSKEQK